MASLARLAEEAATCTRCDLYERATATVFGEGAARARLMLVGEQPGDVEDREGRPFVGPAGRLLDKAVAEAGIVRRQAYLTNAVKHSSGRSEASAGSTSGPAGPRSSLAGPGWNASWRRLGRK